MNQTKDDYIRALEKLSGDAEDIALLQLLVHKHFSMIDHMKATSLYDVYEYEDKIARHTLEPMKMLMFDNERLKKEVNKLRKQLGMVEKYKEREASEE